MVVLAAFACERSPTSVPQRLTSTGPFISPSSEGSLLSCPTLPYDSVTQVIGPAGGSISVGPHRLLIPPGAVYKDEVSITAVLPMGAGVSTVDLRPSGYRFKTPVYLSMSYATCQESPLSKQVAYTVGGKVVEKRPSVDDAQSQTVTGQLDHFSNYAVAW